MVKQKRHAGLRGGDRGGVKKTVGYVHISDFFSDGSAKFDEIM